MAGKTECVGLCFLCCVFVICAVLVKSNFTRDKRLIKLPMGEAEIQSPIIPQHKKENILFSDGSAPLRVQNSYLGLLQEICNSETSKYSLHVNEEKIIYNHHLICRWDESCHLT